MTSVPEATNNSEPSNSVKKDILRTCNYAKKNHFVFVKAEVLASMKSDKYKSILVFDKRRNNIVRAACKCTAG